LLKIFFDFSPQTLHFFKKGAEVVCSPLPLPLPLLLPSLVVNNFFAFIFGDEFFFGLFVFGEMPRPLSMHALHCRDSSGKRSCMDEKADLVLVPHLLHFFLARGGLDGLDILDRVLDPDFLQIGSKIKMPGI
jgi:hypothetical protein